METSFRQRAEMPRDNNGLRHSFQPSMQMESVQIFQLGSAFGKMLSNLKAPLHSQSGRAVVAAAVKVARRSHRGCRATAV
jgi:hypothetical protein